MNRSFANNSYSSTNTRMIPSNTDWESLREQARQLENEIDTKLMSFSKLCSTYVAHDQTSYHHIHHGLDSSGSATSSSSSFETMSIDIEKLLERLSDLNKRMNESISTFAGSNSPAIHTLKRHHEIHQDYRREFERTKANIRNFQTRENLLINHKSDTNKIGANNRRQDYYLREMEQINNSNKLMDRNIELALNFKKDLLNQRKLFVNITHKVKTMTNRFPLMNNILQKIKLKKRKDSLVLAVVIGFCLIILFLYMLR